MIYKNGREVKRTGAHHRFTPGIPDTEDRSSSGHAAQRDCRIKCQNSNDRKNAEAVPEMGVSPASEQQKEYKSVRKKSIQRTKGASRTLAGFSQKPIAWCDSPFGDVLYAVIEAVAA